MEPLGIRNNNPLNIRRGKTLCKGETPSDSPSKGRTQKSLPIEGEVGRGSAFCKFESMEWGLRAAFCLLRTYRDKYKLNSIADIIMRWAPPSENRTAQYIRNVCRWTGFAGMQRLTESDWPTLVKAMARQETGVELDESVILAGFRLYRGS